MIQNSHAKIQPFIPLGGEMGESGFSFGQSSQLLRVVDWNPAYY